MKSKSYNHCDFYTLEDGNTLVVFKGKPIAFGHMEWHCPRDLKEDAKAVMFANEIEPNITAYTTQRHLDGLWKKEKK